MKEIKRLLALCLALLAVLTFSSCALMDKALTKEYVHGDFHITVKGAFTEETDADELGDFAFVYYGLKSGFGALCETNSELASAGIYHLLDAQDYAEFYKSVFEITSATEFFDEIPSIEYTETVEGDEFFYMHFFYATEEGFWNLTCWSLTEDKEEMRPCFISWAKTVSFGDKKTEE